MALPHGVNLQFVIVVFPVQTHFLFVIVISAMARLGFKDRVWFVQLPGHCSWFFCSKQYQYGMQVDIM